MAHLAPDLRGHLRRGGGDQTGHVCLNRAASWSLRPGLMYPKSARRVLCTQKEASAMDTALRQTDIAVVGDMPWGTHLCHFYETPQDLLDTVVPYVKAGLEHHECCLWVLSEPLTEQDARSALRRVVPDLDHYLAERRLEL